MVKDVVCLMTTVVTELIRFDKTKINRCQERMRYFEVNGYYNVVELKKIFAVEVED